jgi:hypothetical protein
MNKSKVRFHGFVFVLLFYKAEHKPATFVLSLRMAILQSPSILSTVLDFSGAKWRYGRIETRNRAPHPYQASLHTPVT